MSLNFFSYEDDFKEYLEVLRINKYVSNIDFTEIEEKVTGIKYPSINFKYKPFKTSEAEAFIWINDNKIIDCIVSKPIFLFETELFKGLRFLHEYKSIKIFKNVFDEHFDRFFKYYLHELNYDFEEIKIIMKRNLYKEDYDVNLIKSKLVICKYNL